MLKRVLGSLAAAVCLCMVGLAAPAGAQICEPLDNGRIADVFYESTAVHFQPVVEFRQMVLTITGPCEDIVRTFTPKDTIFFDIREIQRVTDGSYTWQLRRVAADPGLEEELQSIRGSGKEDAVWWDYFQAGKIPAGPYVDSGSFTVVRGQIVDPSSGEEKSATLAGKGAGSGSSTAIQASLASSATAGGSGGPVFATKDFVINDDLVVIGSTCVGFDCVNGEVFGFDTIRLKENNLRIQFNDTSTASSFPTTNWQIRANSSANGGESFLGFMDQGATGEAESGTRVFGVEAGAGADALFVESGGDVGLGTGNPVLNLHVVDGDSPGLRLEQDGSSGFAPQTWDIAGNETNFFVRDVTSGSRLPFRIRPGAASSTIFINNDSNVGIGTTSPSEKLDIHVAGATRIQLSNTTAATDWNFANDGNGDFAVSRVGSGGNDFEIEQDGDIGNCGNPDHDFVISVGPGCTATPRSWIDAGDTQFSTSSSRALKANLAPVAPQGILEKIEGIPVYEYDFISGPQDRIGLMAEDFHVIFQRGSDTELSGHEMQVAMWLAIQELIARNDKLTEQNRSLVEAVEELQSRMK